MKLNNKNVSLWNSTVLMTYKIIMVNSAEREIMQITECQYI